MGNMGIAAYQICSLPPNKTPLLPLPKKIIVAGNVPVKPCSFAHRACHMAELCYVFTQRIRGYLYNEMRYINLRFTYFLTYFKTATELQCKLTTGTTLVCRIELQHEPF